jgi:hypothetical protein
MATLIEPVKMCFTFGPNCCRTGPLVVGLAVSWLFCVVWMVVSLWTFQFNAYWSLLIFASTVLFGVILAAMTQGVLIDAQSVFCFELSSDEAVLITIDKLRSRQSTQMVLLKDVKYAEYYPFTDSACVILHTSYAQMEIPLWTMGQKADDVIAFLEGCGINVVNVQSDDQIPTV